MKKLISKMTLSVLSLSIAMQAQTAHADRGTVVAATISGAIIGGLIGSSIAQNFDDNDNRQAQRVFNRALSRDYSDSPYAWEGNGHRGRLVFTGEGYFDGQYCRIYRSEVWDSRSNSPMVSTGYVCRSGDGSWSRREAGSITEARRDRPDRGRRFDPPPQQQQQMGPQGMPQQQMGQMGQQRGGYPQQGQQMDQRRGGFPQQQQQGFPQQGRQMGGPGMSGGGGYSGGGSTSTSSGTVLTNGDALPITGVN